MLVAVGIKIEGTFGLRNALAIGPVVLGLLIGSVFGLAALWAAILHSSAWEDHLLIGLSVLAASVLIGLSFRLGFVAFAPHGKGRLRRVAALVCLIVLLLLIGVGALLAHLLSGFAAGI